MVSVISSKGYEPIVGMRQARQGLTGVVYNFLTRPTYFKDGQLALTVQRFFDSLSEHSDLSDLVPTANISVSDKKHTELRMNSSDNQITGSLRYFPPLSPNPDHPLASVYVEFKVGDNVDPQKYSRLKEAVDSWKDKNSFYISTH